MESIAIADAALQWGAGGESKKFCCEPRYLIFAKGTAMVVVGSESEPGLNGSKGVVEDFDELECMYGTARGAEGDDAAPAGELPRACARIRGRGQELSLIHI